MRAAIGRAGVAYDRGVVTKASIPITVIGGYLGAGKTTLVNSLLHQTDGVRLGVVVNDFGEIGVDASVLQPVDAEEAGGGAAPIYNLANGCVCCTLGDDLRATLTQLASLDPPLDHIVIEASGVADPASAAAWGTVPGFAPGGVVVLAAADSVMSTARDRYVGNEVVRQLEGADLVLITKPDLCDAARIGDVVEWVSGVTDAPSVVAAHGILARAVVLGSTPRASSETGDRPGHDADDAHRESYVAWSRSTPTVEAHHLDRFLANLPEGLLRMKGIVDVRDGSGKVCARLVQVVGRTVSVATFDGPGERGLEAVGIAGVLDVLSLDRSAKEYLGDW